MIFKIDDYLEEYLYYHNSIDEFIWLIKLMYAPKEIIKSKKYRTDELFQHYVKKNKIQEINNSNSFFGKKNSKRLFSYYLRQGWYNEISLCYPFSKHQI